jgi:hypothetical protein
MTDYDVIGGLREFDALSQVEYGVSVVDVLDDPERLRRLTGIMIKKPFGTPVTDVQFALCHACRPC